MDKATLKGKAENIKGRVKQAVGSLTGNKSLEAEGLAERTKGAAHEEIGKVNEAIEKEAGREAETQEETVTVTTHREH